MRIKFVLLFVILLLFLSGCNKEPSLVEQAMIQKEARLAAEAVQANKTVEVPKEVIPAEFLESCKFNQKIKFFDYREDSNICINSEGEHVIYIENMGFDPIISIKVISGPNNYESEEKELGAGSKRIYRLEGIKTVGINTVQIIPRGKHLDGKIYDCKASELTYSVSNIKDCIN